MLTAEQRRPSLELPCQCPVLRGGRREFTDRACGFVHGDLAVRFPSGVGSGNGDIAGAFSELVPVARQFIRVITQRQRADHCCALSARGTRSRKIER
jgi:hypothetical protein